MRKYFNETNDVHYVSDMGYAPNDKPQAWNSYFDAAKVTDEAEKEAFVEYGHRLYAILKEANNGVDISMSASAYKTIRLLQMVSMLLILKKMKPLKKLQKLLSLQKVQ